MVPPSMIARNSRVTPTRIIPTPGSVPRLFESRHAFSIISRADRKPWQLFFCDPLAARGARSHKPCSFTALYLAAIGDSVALRETRRVGVWPAKSLREAAANGETTESSGGCNSGQIRFRASWMQDCDVRDKALEL